MGGSGNGLWSAPVASHAVYFVVLLRGIASPISRWCIRWRAGPGPLLSSMVAIVLLGEHLSAPLGLVGIVGVVWASS